MESFTGMFSSVSRLTLPVISAMSSRSFSPEKKSLELGASVVSAITTGRAGNIRAHHTFCCSYGLLCCKFPRKFAIRDYWRVESTIGALLAVIDNAARQLATLH